MKTKVILRAPILTRSGYGEHGRFVARALRQAEDMLDIYILPMPWGKCGWIYEDDEERRWLDGMIKKTALYQNQTKGNPQYDMSIQVTIPNEWENMAPVNVGVTAGIETNKVSPLWLEKANYMNKVVTISEHSKNTFLNSSYDVVHRETGQAIKLKYDKQIDVVHYPVKKFEEVDLNLNLSTDFNFLTVAQWGPRKNLENTITWFVEEFIDNPSAGLIVKSFQGGNSTIDRHYTTILVENLLSKYKERKCKIYLLHGDMSDQEMHSLYKHSKIKALVSLTHGEGFGLPLFEAAYSGLPVMAPEWSGHVDFLFAPKKDKKSGKEKMRPHFSRIDYDIGPVPPHAVWENVIEKDSMWAYPQQGSYKMRLREVYKEYGRFKKQASNLQKWVLENFSEEKQYDTLLTSLVPKYAERLSNDDFDDLFSSIV